MKPQKHLHALNNVMTSRGKNTPWKDLLNLTETFQQAKDGCEWAEHFSDKKWTKIFLTKMIEKANKIGDWIAVTLEAEKGTAERKNAVQNVYVLIQGSRVLSQWEKLQRILSSRKEPEYMAMIERARLEAARIRKEKNIKADRRDARQSA